MSTSLARFFLGCFVPLLLAAGGEPPPPEQTLGQAPAFSLKDQWRTAHQIDFPNDKALIIGFADRHSAYDVEGWHTALSGRYGERVYMRGVAALDDCPFLWRPWVRPILRREVAEQSVLLDWRNEVAARYDFEPRKVNVHVISCDGRRLVQVNGRATEERLAVVFDVLDKLVAPEADEKTDETEAAEAGAMD